MKCQSDAERNIMSPSVVLRESGERLETLGLDMEKSQVEDGDPPYKISEAKKKAIEKIREDLAWVLRLTYYQGERRPVEAPG